MSATEHRPLRRATIEDVAERAGVSVATVSRALRGLPNVAESTRARVTEAAAGLHYQPDPAASRLAAGRSTTVTAVVPTLNGWYFSTVVAGAEAVCREAGYDFVVMAVAGPHDHAHLLHESGYLERRTDGVILVDLTLTEQVARTLHSRGLALATVGSETPGYPSVTVDDAGVGRAATEHLLDLGHTRIGVIGAHQHDPMCFDVPGARMQGHQAAMRLAGMGLDDELFAVGSFGVEGGQEAMAHLLDLSEPPTAVFAMSDEMAFGALIELGVRGQEPGTDVSLIGVDDHEFARVVGLTTIRQRVASHGAIAAQLLIDSMDPNGRPDADTTHRAPVELVVRGTTGPPRRRG